MKPYTMLVFFSGKGEALGHAAGFVTSRAEGVILGISATTPVADAGALQIPPGTAQFETVVMAQDNRSWEAGRVTFPQAVSYLDVDTVIPGSFQNFADGHSAGSICWRVLGGGGIFAGATGVVTGNFIGYPDGSFTDHQLFKLILPAASGE